MPMKSGLKALMLTTAISAFIAPEIGRAHV
jgi:hypothetical protein